LRDSADDIVCRFTLKCKTELVTNTIRNNLILTTGLRLTVFIVTDGAKH